MRYASIAPVNKTVYLRDEEVPIWEKARELSGDKLSPVIVASLRRFVAERKAEAKGFQRIEVRFNDCMDNRLPKVKAFYGKWIFDLERPLTLVVNEDSRESDKYSIAETAKGSVVVYKEQHDPEGFLSKFLVYRSFTEAARDSEVNYAIREALEKRGVPVEELDI
jgi:hypothetical protein